MLRKRCRRANVMGSNDGRGSGRATGGRRRLAVEMQQNGFKKKTQNGREKTVGGDRLEIKKEMRADGERGRSEKAEKGKGGTKQIGGGGPHGRAMRLKNGRGGDCTQW